MDFQPIKQILQRRDFGADVLVQGWVRTRRDSKGGFSFLAVNDGSCFGDIQVVAPAELSNYEAEILKIVTAHRSRTADDCTDHDRGDRADLRIAS